MAIPTYDQIECRDSGPCSAYITGICADCNSKIPSEETDLKYRNMAGRGFRAQTSDHNHVKGIRGLSGISPIFRELCLDCYRVDFAKKYPGEPLPV